MKSKKDFKSSLSLPFIVKVRSVIHYVLN